MQKNDTAWFAEPPFFGYQQRYEVTERLQNRASQFQTIDIFATASFGTMLALDGAVQTTERDEYIYHEMLVHLPLITHTEPHKVAIIGGGDGGSLRRVLQFPSIERAVQIELDREVTDTCRQFLPSISAGAFDSPRADLLFTDGVRFLAETTEKFDVILIDSTDPVGPAEALFSEEFYRNAYRALNNDGILVTQSGSPWLMTDELARARSNLNAVFGLTRIYLASIPSYPGVLWSFMLASKGRDPLAVPVEEIARRLAEANIETAYYTPEVHKASFALPQFISARLEEGKKIGPFAS